MLSKRLQTALSLRCYLFALVVVLLWGNSSGSALAYQDSYTRFDRIEEVVDSWSKEKRLWIRGDVSVAQDQLSRLDAWLESNGEQWTIVLMDNADGQAYQAVDGRRFSGMDAVEFALGHGLANRTRFGELSHPETGETSGAVFVLFLAERKFSYYGSDVHDRRGLGESHWIGDLDRPAVRAMRNGGRIVDAVKDTVSSINSAVENRIRREEEAARQAAEEQERLQRELERQLSDLNDQIENGMPAKIDEVNARATQLRATFPEAADSELANPPIDNWTKALAELRSALKKETIPATRQRLNQIRDEINRRLDAFAAHESFDDMLDTAESNLLLLEKDRSGAANEQAKEVNLLLNDARTGHVTGNLDFAEKIHRANELIREGTNAIRLEQQRLAQVEEKRIAVRRTLLVVGGAAAFILIVLLWLLNRKRRPWLRKAHDLYEKRSAVAGAELEEVAALKLRANEILGPRDSFEDRNFTGNTVKLATTAFEKLERVDELASELKLGLVSAERLLHPPGVIAEAMNLFSSGRYMRCYEQLIGRSFKGSDSPAENQWMIFEEFVSTIQNQRNEATSDVDEFENCVNSKDEKLVELRRRIDEAEESAAGLERASRLDRHFEIESMADELIQAVESDYDRARDVAETDPVRLVKEIVPGGVRKISDGMIVARAISEMRETVFPVLDQASRTLQQHGFETRWIKRRVEELGEVANEVLQLASESPAETEAGEFATDTRELGVRVKRCVELATELNEVVTPRISKLREEVGNTRRAVASRLSIAATDVLHENDYDPDVELEQARRQLESAKAALNIGGVAACDAALEEANVEIQQGHRLLEVTIELVDSFESRIEETESGLRNVQAQVDAQREVIAVADRQYASAALQFPTGDDVDGDAQPDSIETHLSFGLQLIDSATDSIDRIRNTHRQGRILEAAALSDNVNADLDLTTGLFEEIKNHCRRLEELTRENSTVLDSYNERVQVLTGEYTDNRTRQETINRFYSLNEDWREFATGFDAASLDRNPFADEARLDAFEKFIEEVENLVNNDRQLFEVAREAVAGLSHQNGTLENLLRQATDDQIPDSRSIDQARRDFDSAHAFVKELTARIETPHQDWVILEKEASDASNRSAVVGGTLRRELKAAQDAVRQFNDAAARVRDAANWGPVFSHGVRISGNHGQHSLRDARESLANGDYGRCIRESSQAMSKATIAISDADRELSRRKQRERRERARKRRERQSTFSSSFGSNRSSRSSSRSSGISFGGSSSRSSGFGGSSRSSSSSFGGSKSGFSRSGW